MGLRDDLQGASEANDYEVVDWSLAVTGEPIIGTDKIIYDDATGPGALDVRPMPSPIYDITHLPYDPSCEICVSTRRPSTQHRALKPSVRAVPLMVGDYAFPKHSDESEPLTLLVTRIYQFKLFFCCAIPCKGHNPLVVRRLERFIRECGLTHFTYRSDREPAIQAMMEEAAALCGRNGTKDMSKSDGEAIDHAQLVDGGVLSENPVVVDDPNVDVGEAVTNGEVVPVHTIAPELTHPGESQSNGLAERSVGIFED